MKILAFIKKDFQIMVSYRFRLFLMLFQFLLSLIFLYFFSKTFSGNLSPYLKNYRGGYFAFALIGLSVSNFITVGLHSFANEIRSSQVEGTLEALMSTHTSIFSILIGNSMWSFIKSYISALFMLGVGFLFLDYNFSFLSIVNSLLILTLVFLSFLSVGILSASFIMIFKQGNPINLIFGYSSYFFGGIIFPVEVLPSYLQKVSAFLPITYGVKALRQILISQTYEVDIIQLLINLVIFILIVSPIAFCSFYYAIRRAKIDGSLVQY